MVVGVVVCGGRCYGPMPITACVPVCMQLLEFVLIVVFLFGNMQYVRNPIRFTWHFN